MDFDIYIHAASAQGCGDWHFAGAGCKGGRYLGFTDRLFIGKGKQTKPFTLWLFNIAVENGPFIDDFPIKTSIYKGFSMAMLNNQMVGNDEMEPSWNWIR